MPFVWLCLDMLEKYFQESDHGSEFWNGCLYNYGALCYPGYGEKRRWRGLAWWWLKTCGQVEASDLPPLVQNHTGIWSVKREVLLINSMLLRRIVTLLVAVRILMIVPLLMPSGVCWKRRVLSAELDVPSLA